jgi:hypothetical protein
LWRLRGLHVHPRPERLQLVDDPIELLLVLLQPLERVLDSRQTLSVVIPYDRHRRP